MTLLYVSGFVVMLITVGYLLPLYRQHPRGKKGCLVYRCDNGRVFDSHYNDIEPLLRMAVIVFLQLLSMKALVAIETYSGENKLTIIQWIAFSTGWFGMRPRCSKNFLHPRYLILHLS
jgi:hypothetical protein